MSDGVTAFSPQQSESTRPPQSVPDFSLDDEQQSQNADKPLRKEDRANLASEAVLLEGNPKAAGEIKNDAYVKITSQHLSDDHPFNVALNNLEPDEMVTQEKFVSLVNSSGLDVFGPSNEQVFEQNTSMPNPEASLEAFSDSLMPAASISAEPDDAQNFELTDAEPETLTNVVNFGPSRDLHPDVLNGDNVEHINDDDYSLQALPDETELDHGLNSVQETADDINLVEEPVDSVELSNINGDISVVEQSADLNDSLSRPPAELDSPSDVPPAALNEEQITTLTSIAEAFEHSDGIPIEGLKQVYTVDSNIDPNHPLSAAIDELKSGDNISHQDFVVLLKDHGVDLSDRYQNYFDNSSTATDALADSPGITRDGSELSEAPSAQTLAAPDSPVDSASPANTQIDGTVIDGLTKALANIQKNTANNRSHGSGMGVPGVDGPINDVLGFGKFSQSVASLFQKPVDLTTDVARDAYKGGAQVMGAAAHVPGHLVNSVAENIKGFSHDDRLPVNERVEPNFDRTSMDLGDTPVTAATGASPSESMSIGDDYSDVTLINDLESMQKFRSAINENVSMLKTDTDPDGNPLTSEMREILVEDTDAMLKGYGRQSEFVNDSVGSVSDELKQTANAELEKGRETLSDIAELGEGEGNNRLKDTAQKMAESLKKLVDMIVKMFKPKDNENDVAGLKA